MEWLEDVVVGNKSNNSPFFLYIGPHAPHYPATIPAWYQNVFLNETAPRTKNFNVLNSDAHEMVANNPPLNETGFGFIDQLWRDR